MEGLPDEDGLPDGEGLPEVEGLPDEDGLPDGEGLPDEDGPSDEMTAPSLPDSEPGPWDDTIPWSEVWFPDWKEDTWLSSKGVMAAGLAEAAVLINRVQLVHIHKNDFHLLSLIISLVLFRMTCCMGEILYHTSWLQKTSISDDKLTIYIFFL